jgi:hypothetical protein
MIHGVRQLLMDHPCCCALLMVRLVQVRRLKMYSKTAKRDKKGKILHQVRASDTS